MRRVSLDMTRPGMVLAKTILGGTGQALLQAGIEIKPQYITYLKRLGINYIYIQDKRIEDVEINDLISEETRHKARIIVKNTMKSFQTPGTQKKGFNVQDKQLIKTVSKIINEVMNSREVIVQLVDIRAKDDYLFAHSVNCSILTTLVAIKMGYKSKSLKALATGTLLHDLGMIHVPENILNKPGDLTEDEYKTVKNHAFYGYELFKKTSLFSALAGDIIVQHHERIQGQGYPQGLKGDKINPLAQIISIVDVYDALTSERPYRNAYLPHQAVEMLFSWGGEAFEMTILTVFLSMIAAYPLGFQVLLSNGESGLVIGNNPGCSLRPIVRVLYSGEDLAPHPKPYDLDLAKNLNLTIISVLS